MIGKHLNFRDTDHWVDESAPITPQDGFDANLLQTQFEGCIGAAGDEGLSPILRLARSLKRVDA
jgi:hypothetical protein